MSEIDEIVAWLRAQLDEDERVARAVPPGFDLFNGTGIVVMPIHGGTTRSVTLPSSVAAFAVRFDPARALREVEAKRRIVDLLETEERVHAEHDEYTPGVNKLWGGGRRSALRQVARLLALPSADREGYREEWRPE